MTKKTQNENSLQGIQNKPWETKNEEEKYKIELKESHCVGEKER